ncbi:MAG: class I SAM-dependent methyltransferase [Candidatus Limnocylindria bacterium]
MSAQVPPASVQFDRGAAGYAATMAPSLRRIAAEVVRRADLRAGERVLDVGSGTGIAAAAAVGDRRAVIGVDGAASMLEHARRDVPAASFQVMDFMQLAFPAGSFDAVISSHALLFADERPAALAEWRRVTRPGGRLSLSVPGPVEVTPTAVYRQVYERHGIDTSGRYPTPDELAGWATAAGWTDVDVHADPTTAIRLPDASAFRTWREIGSRGQATDGWTPEQHDTLTAEMLAVTPRDADGWLRIPFGALYLVAGNP